MKIRNVIVTFAAALAVSSCSDFDSVLSSSESGDGKMAQGGTPVATEFGITVEEMEGETSTRTTIAGNGKDVLWATGDKIYVFDTPLTRRLFTLTNGAGTTNGTFEGEAVASDKYYAIYPSSSDASTCSDEGVVETVMLFNTQGTKVDDTKANGSPAKIMMGVANSDRNITFKNVSARLDINLSGIPQNTGNVMVTFSSNGGETLSGYGTIDWNNGAPKYIDFIDTYNYVNCPNANASDRLYVIPNTLNSGFTICVEILGQYPGKYYFHSNNPITFVRNKVYTFNLDLNKPNGIGSVDLGLPSGLLINSMNVGATKIAEMGDFYAWGEKAKKSEYNWANYEFNTTNTENIALNKYVLYRNRSHGKDGNWYDGKGALEAVDDYISVITNGSQRMPTADEITEFVNNVTVEPVKLNNTNMYKCTSKINGKSVYFPYAGDKNGTTGSNAYASIWTKSAASSYQQAYDLHIDNNGTTFGLETTLRRYGRNLRGVEPKDKHEYVDMGAAGKWATTNVGASVPEDFGNHYAWAEIATKTNYEWSTYKWGSSSSALTKYTTVSSVMANEDDAAVAEWGSDWVIPTEAQFQALIEACTWTKNMEGSEAYSGVEGWIGSLKTNVAKTIFFPCAGYKSGTYFYPYLSGMGGGHLIGEYWTRNLKYVNSGTAVYIEPNPTTITAPQIKSETRERGLTIRPIHK